MIDGFFEYVGWGLLGALAHILVMKVWNEKTYVIREVGLALIMAVVVFGFGLPNKFTTFSISFMGVDAIEAFLRRVSGRSENGLRMS